MSKNKDRLFYLGSGEFIPGVPARNLTAAESAQFADLIRDNQTATGKTLYSVSRSIEQPLTAEEVADA
jgi:hypothetical protein